MAALPVNLLHILGLAVYLIHGARQSVLVLLVLRVFCVRVVVRAYQAIFVRIRFTRRHRIFLVNTIVVGQLLAFKLQLLLTLLAWVTRVGARILEQVWIGDHVLHAFLLDLLHIALVLQHATKVLNFGNVANACFMEF